MRDVDVVPRAPFLQANVTRTARQPSSMRLLAPNEVASLVATMQLSSVLQLPRLWTTDPRALYAGWRAAQPPQTPHVVMIECDHPKLGPMTKYRVVVAPGTPPHCIVD